MINSVFLGWHNLEALSADQMAMQIALFSSIGSGGLAQAISVCVGKALGEKKYGALKKYGNVGIVLGTAFPALAFFVLLAVREQFISLYVNTKNPDNAELVRLASSFLLLECLRQLMTAVQFTASGALLGFKDTSFTFKTSLGLSLGLNAALLSLMHFALHMNSLALFSEKAIGVGMAAFLNAFRWVLKSHEQSRQEKEAIKDQSLPYRVSRALTLFCSGSPKEKEERRPENDLAGPLVINAS